MQLPMRFFSIVFALCAVSLSYSSERANSDCPAVWLTEKRAGDFLEGDLRAKGYSVQRSNQETVDAQSKRGEWIVGVQSREQYNSLGQRFCTYGIDVQEVVSPGKRADSRIYKVGRKSGTLLTSYDTLCAKAATRAALAIPACPPH